MSAIIQKIMLWLRSLLDTPRDTSSEPMPVSWSTDVENTSDNVLIHRGRLIIWYTPGGKRVETYETGFQDNWFLTVIRAHWLGIRHILVTKAGAKYQSLEPIPTHVKLEVRSRMSVPCQTAVRAAYSDGSPATAIPDHVVWWVRYGGEKGPTLTFGHTHRGDTMRGRHGTPVAEWFVDGKSIFSWTCNHPHVVVGPSGELLRVDIRYTGGDRKPVVVQL